MKEQLTETELTIIKAIQDKLGTAIRVLNLKNISSICDYFIITSASSIRQAKTIADNIEAELLEIEEVLLNREGYHGGRWILLDYGHVIVHIFNQEDRGFYSLETIWKDAEEIEF